MNKNSNEKFIFRFQCLKVSLLFLQRGINFSLILLYLYLYPIYTLLYIHPKVLPVSQCTVYSLRWIIRNNFVRNNGNALTFHICYLVLSTKSKRFCEILLKAKVERILIKYFQSQCFRRLLCRIQIIQIRGFDGKLRLK